MPDHPLTIAQQPTPPSAMRVEKQSLRRTVRFVLLVLVLIALVLAAWGIVTRTHMRSEVSAQTASDAELTVITAKPAMSDAGYELVLPGTVSAYIEAPIHARTSGYVKAWYTDIGTQVRKGQLLAELETPEVDRQLQQAKADLETAQANLNLSLSTNERWRRLLATKSVSKQDAEEKAGDAAAKTAAAASARANVQRLAQLENFKHVQAPFTGVVTARNTDVGNLINAGESANAELFRVADTHRLRIFVQVPEAFALETKRGLKAELQFAEHPGETFATETVRTSESLDPSGRTLQVELQLDNSRGEILPGAYTEVHLKLPSSVKSMRLPSNTVLFRAAGLQVATVREGKIKLKNITQGRDFGKTIEVLGGLDANDDVIVNPPDSAFDGTPVRIGRPPPAPTESTPPS
ncbi:MAG: efflux RND transporter periplasmic adaptor subunit [Steroidobacteraceae bacterium]